MYVRPVTNFKGKNVILLALMKGWIIFLCKKKWREIGPIKTEISSVSYWASIASLSLPIYLFFFFFFFFVFFFSSSKQPRQSMLPMLRSSGSCMLRCNVTPRPAKVDVGDLEAKRKVTWPHDGAWSNRAVIFSAIFWPTPEASPSNPNSFGILMRFLARWHQVC